MMAKSLRRIKRVLPFLLVSLIFTVCCYAIKQTEPAAYSSGGNSTTTIAEDNLKIEFFPLGNNYVGDSCLILIGDCQILVDAGSQGNSRNVINERIKNIKSEDDCWDYVIITHGDYDHIAGISEGSEHDVGTSKSVFDYIVQEKKMTIGTLIDFDRTQDPTIQGYESVVWDTNAYKNYADKRAKLIENGGIERYYTASQCCWKQREELDSAPKQGAKNEFVLNDSGDAKLTILYNYYYDHRIGTGSFSSAEKNCMSVCFLITYKTQRFLFTGDLEEYDSVAGAPTEYGYSVSVEGERKLYENNKDLLKYGVNFYKAAHHGSKTSNCELFIDKIHPEIVAISTIAGTSQYTTATTNENDRFPTQCVLSRFLKYTDLILITSKAELKENGEIKNAVDYYGDCLIVSDGSITKAYSTKENDTGDRAVFGGQEYFSAKSILKTEWFMENREDNPDNVRTPKAYVLSGYVDESNTYVGNCTIVKYKHYDILIDCGVYGTFGGALPICSDVFLNKVKKHCCDDYLDYLIVTSPYTYSIQQLVDIVKGNEVIKKGVLSEYNIGTLIDGGICIDPSNGDERSLYGQYKKLVKAKPFEDHYSIKDIKSVPDEIEIDKHFSLKILLNKYYGQIKKETNAALGCYVKYYDKKMLFLGNMTADGEEEIAAQNDLSDTVFFTAIDNGYDGANSEVLLKKIANKDLIIAINTTAGKNIIGKKTLSKSTCKRLINAAGSVYITAELSKGKYSEINGDIIFGFLKTESGSLGWSVKVTGKNVTLDKTTYYSNLK